MSKIRAEVKAREFSFTDIEFKFLADLANQKTGIVLADHKKDMVYSRLVRRLRALELPSFAKYCDFIQSESGADEISNLVNAITTNLTNFFREGYHFDHLRDSVLAPLVTTKSSSSKRLRIWSAGCSSGMEPYSIAMTVKSAMKDVRGWDVGILATDIDTNMLDIGVTGEYVGEQYENIPQEYRHYVEQIKNNNRIKMSEALKELIVFNSLNLMENWPMKGLFDAVFCRNVVIYFDKMTQAKLFNRIADLIKPNGWLYIGHSESLYKISDRFELAGRTIYQKVK